MCTSRRTPWLVAALIPGLLSLTAITAAGAQTAMEIPPGAHISQGPGTQGVEAYVGPDVCQTFIVCLNRPTTQVSEVGDDLHMTQAGYLASFTFQYFTASSSVAGGSGSLPPPGTTIRAEVSFYENDPSNTSVGGLITTILVEDLPTATTDFPDGLVHSETVDVFDCIFLPQDIWMTVDLELPVGSTGSLCGTFGTFDPNDPNPMPSPFPTVGTSMPGNIITECFEGVLDVGQFPSGSLFSRVNQNLTVRLFDECTEPELNTPPTCTITEVQISGLPEDPAAPGFVVTEGETITATFVGADVDEGEILGVTGAGVPAGASLTTAPGDLAAPPLTSTFAWTPTAADKPNAPFNIVVTYTDAFGDEASCTLVISDINLRPECDAGGNADGEIETACTDPQGATVTLTGTASDADDDDASLTFRWDVSDVVLQDPNAPVTSGIFPIGSTMVTLTVSDPRGGFCTADVLVKVVDETPPEVMVTSDCSTLWPPNHSLQEVSLMVVATDDCSDPDEVLPLVVTVRSNEPDDAIGNGDGNTTGDTDGFDGFTGPVDVTSKFTPDPDTPGLYTGTIELRAERAGTGSGRAYIIDITALDSSGNENTASCVIVIPHNQRNRNAN